MNKKLTVLFLILAILPTALLVWLGLSGIASEKDRNRAKVAELSLGRLEIEKAKARDLFSKLEKELLAFRDVKGVGDARQRLRKSALVRQVFAIDAKGMAVYPAEDQALGQALSEAERDFLGRTKELGLSPGLFQRKSEEAPGSGPDAGWYSWYLVDGINFIFWMKAPAKSSFVPGGLLGLELNRMAVLKAVLGVFPATSLEDEAVFRVVLADLGGKPLYQWGGYGPASGEAPLAQVNLDPPIASWSLKYYASPEALKLSAASFLPIAASIGFLILAVLGLAFYLYRESTREIRDALERVSFVNQVSHELKTPLTNIRLYADLLEGVLKKNDETARSYLTVISAESGRLSRLIGNVLTFAKESRHGLTCSPAPADPEAHVRKAAENFLPSLKAKGIRLDLDLKAPGAAILDADVLEQIVNNLVSNGEKYAGLGGWIGVILERREEFLVLRVSDRGPGIPPKFREKVFLPFFRLSNKATDGVAGAGIGLALVRSLARLHGGEAKVLASETGAVFEVTLRAPEAEEGKA